MTEILLVVGVLVMVTSQMAVKAFLDTTFGNPKYHDGTRNDRWHVVGRVDAYLDGIAWLLVLYLGIGHSWRSALITALVALVTLLTGRWVFRRVARRYLSPERYEVWYP